MRQTATTVGVVALLLLAGCGSLLGGSGPASSTATDEPTVQPTDTPGEAATPDSSDPADTPTASPTADPTATPTDTPTAEPTPTPASTATPSPTPAATATATPEPTPGEPDVVLRGGNLSVDEDEVYANVEELLGTDVEPPTVYVREEMPGLDRVNQYYRSQPFYSVFGYGDTFINTSVYHGSASPDRIVVMPKDANESQVETLLAHEYVHWMQFHSDAINTGGFGEFVNDSDSRQVAAGFVEGASVYVTDQYVDRYMNTSWNQTQELRNQYDRGPAGRRLFRARYLYGAQYIHSEVESPRNVSWLYDDSTPTPVTSEQLVHGETPSEEPEANLTVSVNGTGDWRVASDHYDTKGEIVVRTMLRAELNRSVAARAAAGWGSDHAVQMHDSDNQSRVGIAWALRWDDAGEAEEFADAFAEWQQARPDDDGTAYRLVRVDEQTVAVLAGDNEFVANATASGSNTSVTVSAAG